MKAHHIRIGPTGAAGPMQEQWRRDVPKWHWRYWTGYRWRDKDARTYSGVDHRHFQTDKQRARQALEEWSQDYDT